MRPFSIVTSVKDTVDCSTIWQNRAEFCLALWIAFFFLQLQIIRKPKLCLSLSHNIGNYMSTVPYRTCFLATPWWHEMDTSSPRSALWCSWLNLDMQVCKRSCCSEIRKSLVHILLCDRSSSIPKKILDSSFIFKSCLSIFNHKLTEVWTIRTLEVWQVVKLLDFM